MLLIIYKCYIYEFLFRNKMNILPTEELHLTSLTELNISHNYIRSIPDDFLKQLINLQSLSASNNELGIHALLSFMINC